MSFLERMAGLLSSNQSKIHANSVNKLNGPSAEQNESQHKLLDVVEKALVNAMQSTWQVVAGMENIKSKISCNICEATGPWKHHGTLILFDKNGRHVVARGSIFGPGVNEGLCQAPSSPTVDKGMDPIGPKTQTNHLASKRWGAADMLQRFQAHVRKGDTAQQEICEVLHGVSDQILATEKFRKNFW